MLFTDPGAPARIRDELAAEARARGVDNPAKLCGIALGERGLAGEKPVENTVSAQTGNVAISTENRS